MRRSLGQPETATSTPPKRTVAVGQVWQFMRMCVAYLKSSHKLAF